MRRSKGLIDRMSHVNSRDFLDVLSCNYPRKLGQRVVLVGLHQLWRDHGDSDCKCLQESYRPRVRVHLIATCAICNSNGLYWPFFSMGYRKSPEGLLNDGIFTFAVREIGMRYLKDQVSLIQSRTINGFPQAHISVMGH
jgi:hypothetical protein